MKRAEVSSLGYIHRDIKPDVSFVTVKTYHAELSLHPRGSHSRQRLRARD